MTAGILYITVREGRHLKDEELIGKGDPFVEAYVDKHHPQRTSVKPNTDNPIWNETLKIPINEGQNHLYLR
ncbi:hypothetical protein HK102_010195, partial [Quaeritorhiza haematococci]